MKKREQQHETCLASVMCCDLALSIYSKMFFSGELSTMESPNQLKQRPSEAFPERSVCRHGDRLWSDRAV